MCLCDPYWTLWGYVGYFHDQSKSEDLNTQLLDAGTVLQNVSLPLERPFSPGVVCEHGSVETAGICKELKCLSVIWVFFFPLWSTQLKLGRRECPSENSCSSSKDKYHADEEKGRGLPVKLGPGEQLFSWISAPLSLWGSQFILSLQLWGWKFLRWPAPIQQRSRALEYKLPRVRPRVSPSFLASGSKPKWLIWVKTPSKGLWVLALGFEVAQFIVD